MQQLKQHLAYKIIALSVLAALFAPSMMKFAHIFEHHNHIVCKGDSSTHFHQVDLECEFYKFQLNNHFYLPYENDNWLDVSHQYQISTLTYNFFYNNRQLSFSLRAPPILV